MADTRGTVYELGNSTTAFVPATKQTPKVYEDSCVFGICFAEGIAGREP
ncbi:MAG: hypothetical protein UY53_C0001G0092 [Parcubacteria group bacterium GW2011_GWA2_50_10]|uniref:Uncharacterized protein n=1 Tax=Candidatus Yanofskybacteria bacterium GW2011_GWC1_48_11 TaxID=1619027 RepID=A0A837IPT7_9BACT|nr:MAG: hypothetical protein UY25_C0003G0066 [Candidatus Yanofskybacteria bacterium GW2011_GWC1_48_11]KKW08445.1 MAG: hypothetical protein UY45_C0007G0068 [Parcubacteria group bacterium GW2011_GWA1_49_26]KKW14376.1 MAG: hypothetical protein UY53_C0001G0092 [Parcubacteria group bacterium GW2011_GWA2_50_10]